MFWQEALSCFLGYLCYIVPVAASLIVVHFIAHIPREVFRKLLHLAVEDMRSKGITPLYLLTDHTGFYERYGWEFYTMVQGDGEPEPSRMYIHR